LLSPLLDLFELLPAQRRADPQGESGREASGEVHRHGTRTSVARRLLVELVDVPRCDHTHPRHWRKGVNELQRRSIHRRAVAPKQELSGSSLAARKRFRREEAVGRGSPCKILIPENARPTRDLPLTG